MKAYELMNELYGKDGFANGGLVDCCKSGSPDTELGKVAVCCIATADVIRQAAQWGAVMLITHEPTYHDHFDKLNQNDRVTMKKAELLKETGLTVWRYHDCPHSKPDEIHEGFIEALEWKGSFNGSELFILDTPSSARELAADIESKLGFKHVRMVGNVDLPCKSIGLCLGAGLCDISSDKYDVVINGELCEWRDAEYVRDAAQLGFKKSMIVLGHMASEKEPMRMIAVHIKEKYPELEIRYFDCGDVYI